MAEVRDDKERLDLYRKLLNDPATRTATAKLSYKQWESKLLNDDNVLQKVADYATKKNWALDAEDFVFKYTPEKVSAPPAPKQKPAPVAPPVAIEEEEVEMPEPQPLVGSPEYDQQLKAQYGGMAPTLGATFGGAPAAFETKEQKKQEQISPAFKAQKLAFEDVPIAEEQRRAQKQFAKATKQQQQAALRGGTGFELEQKRKRKERGYGEAAADLAGTIAAGGKRIGENIVSTLSNYVNSTLRAGLPEIEATDSVEELANYELYNNAKKAQDAFQDEVAKRNIQTSVLQAIEKGEYRKIPEATLYTIGDAAMQIIPAILTMGGSTYFQTLPQAYKDGVDAVAKEEGISPEQVVASGKDAKIVAQISSGIQSGLEFAGANLVSSSIASRGGYKVMRDWLLGQGVNRNLARGASLLGVGIGEGITEYLQEGTGQAGAIAAKSPTTKAFFDNLPNELFTPEAKKQRREAFVSGVIGGMGVGGGGQVFQSAMDRTLFEAPKIGKATQRPDMDVVQIDNKIQERNKIAQAMEEAVRANPEAEGQIRQQYQKRINESAPADNEVLMAYESLALLPETDEKNTIRENLEAYMAEKGLQPQPSGIEAGLGEGLRVTAPQVDMEETITEEPPIAPEDEVDTVEEIPIEEVPEEEELSLEDQLMLPEEEAAPAEEEVVTEEVAEEPAPQPKDGDFVIVNGEKGVVTISPGGQISVETDTKIYDLDERGLAGIGGKLVTPKEKTQTEYEVEVIDDDNAIVNGEPFKIIRDEKGNTIALQGETRTIRTEPVMVDVDIKRNKAQVTETLQEQSEQVESLSPDMTLDKQGFVDDIIGQNMTEGVDRILSEGVTEKTAEKDLLQFKLFVEATIADLRARQKGNPYADAMIEQLQEALNTVYYEYYSQTRKAEARASKTQKKTDRGVKGKERVSPKPAEGKQPTAPVKPAPVTPKKEAAPKPEPKKEAPKPEAKKEETPTEEKLVSGTPQEGDKVEIAPQREGFQPRAMVFKDGQWQQNVGGDIVKVGSAVQQQAQEAFAGKAEVKPAETKFKPNPNASYYISKGADEVFYTLREIAGDDLDVHVMNLSKDLEESKKKAKELIGEDVEFDEKSLGRDYNKIKADKTGKGQKLAQRQEGEGAGMNTLSFGKYNGKTIDEVFEIDKPYILYLNKEYSNNTVFQKGVRDNPKIKEFIEQSLADKEQQRKNLESLTEIGGVKFDDKGVAKAVPIKGKIKYINNRMGPQGMYRVYILDTEYGVPVEVSGDIGKYADGKLEQGAELSFTANVQKVGDKFKVIGRKSEYTKPAETKEGKKAEAKEEEVATPEFTSQQSSEAATAFDKAKTSKGFDKKYGKGAYRTLSEITKNFEDIMDKVSEKIKQDCII